MPGPRRILFIIAVLLHACVAFAATSPVVTSFTATPASPVPGQHVTLRIEAYDPDCTAAPCTSACGTAVRSDLLLWSDDTNRSPAAFSNSAPKPTGSPWSATVTWVAPPADGTYTVRASLTDNGGMLCGGRQTRVATLQITVSSAPLPVIDSLTASPSTPIAGGSATLTAVAHDPLGRALTYSFTADAGVIAHPSPSSRTATWTAPQTGGVVSLRCSVSAGGAAATAQTTATVEVGAYSGKLAVPLPVTRLATLPDGRIAAVDGAGNTLAVTTTSGSIVWRATGLATPVAVAAAGGEIFVLERGARRISVWSGSGSRVRALALEAALPNQIAAGPAPGEIAVSDTAAARILVLSALDGRLLRTVGAGMLQFPAGLTARQGQLAVADSGAARLLLFDEGGALVRTLGDSTLFVRPQGVTWDAVSDAFVVSDSFSGEISILSPDGVVRGSLGGFGTAAGKLVNPIDVAFLPGRQLAVTTGGGAVMLYRMAETLPPIAPVSSLVAGDRPGDDGGAVAISWNASPDAGRVTAQRIERTIDEGDEFAVVGTVTGTTSSYVDTSARDGVCYRYRVIVTDGAVDAASERSACAVARNDLAPPSPQGVTAAADSPFDATITWLAVQAPDLARYDVALSSTGVGPIVRSSTVSSLSIAELTPGRAYDVAVQAVDTAGNTSPAAVGSLTMHRDDPPPAPLQLRVEDAQRGGTLDVTWAAAESGPPVEKYRVTFAPAIDGWPAVTREVVAPPVRMQGLVNALEYVVSVAALTPWGREGEAAIASPAAPSAARRALPLVEATDPLVDAAGAAFEFSIAAEKRRLRFEYRTLGNAAEVVLNGAALPMQLADTGGAWVEATLDIEKRLLRPGAVHVIEFRNAMFPTPGTSLSLRRLDFVPLPLRHARLDAYNSVADVVFEWDEWRPDLGVVLQRDERAIVCATADRGRCRDTFLENGEGHVWRAAALSPAGWVGEVTEVRGHAKFEDAPPPVTDLIVARVGESLQLRWTPLSSAVSRDMPPVAVRAYRVYASGALIGEFVTAEAVVHDPAIDPRTLAVRSVDAAGRESQ